MIINIIGVVFVTIAILLAIRERRREDMSENFYIIDNFNLVKRSKKGC